MQLCELKIVLGTILRQIIDMLAIDKPDINMNALCVHWMKMQLSHKPMLLIGAMWW
jgi:hypothetical protein